MVCRMTTNTTVGGPSPRSGTQRDTTAARAAAQRNAEERRAQVMRERGWICLPPERVTEDLRAQLSELNVDRVVPGGKPGSLPPWPLAMRQTEPE